MKHLPGRWRLVVPVAAACAGLLFGVSAAASRGTDLRPGERDLASVVQDANHRVQTQAVQVRRLQLQVNSLSSRQEPGSATLARLDSRNKTLAGQVGLTRVTGSTVTVTLNDSSMDPSRLPDGANVNWLVVHQQDVQAVVNALWKGGATAMMLMDQRIISTSAVRCVGNTLLLKGRVYSPPFTITAMGDVNALQAALQRDPQVSNYRDYVALVGLGYQVTTSDRATFPAYSGSLDLRYAKVPTAKDGT